MFENVLNMSLEAELLQSWTYFFGIHANLIGNISVAPKRNVIRAL